MPVRATVLVALDEDRVIARDQQPRRWVAREVVIQRQVHAPERPGETRLSDSHEARGHRRLVNEPAAEDLIQMAEGADLRPNAPERRPVALRVAHTRTELFGVGAAGGEAGRRLFAGDRRIARRRRW
jgi:hypothetical protein